MNGKVIEQSETDRSSISRERKTGLLIDMEDAAAEGIVASHIEQLGPPLLICRGDRGVEIVDSVPTVHDVLRTISVPESLVKAALAFDESRRRLSSEFYEAEEDIFHLR